MSFISKIKDYIYRKSLEILKKENSSNRTSAGMTFESAESVLLLFDASELDTQKTVQQYAKKLKENNKIVSLLGYFNDKENRENLSFSYYNKKNIDWASRIKGEKINTFLETSFDLLINVNLVSTKAMEYFICQANAKLKAGPVTDQTFIYDLMIDLPANTSIDVFLQQVEFYLRKLNVRQPIPQ